MTPGAGPSIAVTGVHAGRDLNLQIGDRIEVIAPQPVQWPVRYGVPPPPLNVVGRTQEVSDLVALLAKTPCVAAIDGSGGVGKTTLAILVATNDLTRQHFPDGVIWLALGPKPLSIGELGARTEAVHAGFARAVGADLRDCTTAQMRRAKIDAAIGERRVLIVLDDCWQSDLAAAVRSGAPHVAHLLTTRKQGVAVEFAGHSRTRQLAPLTDDEAWELFQQLVGSEICTAYPQQARDLSNAVGGLPLAVELLATYLGPDRTGLPGVAPEAMRRLTNPAERLAQARRRLGSDDKLTLEQVFDLSLEDLEQDAPEAAAAFWAIGAWQR